MIGLIPLEFPVDYGVVAGGVYPRVGTVLVGTMYGPTGDEYDGALVLPSVVEVFWGTRFGPSGNLVGELYSLEGVVAELEDDDIMVVVE